MARYDTIGVNYAALRRPDPRIAAAITAALGTAQTIINVGAGTGSYEPDGRLVTAVEPSAAMIAKRTRPAAAVIQGEAEALPFPDRQFDAAMAILTIHHWRDKAAGLAELRRVTRGPILLLSFDPAQRPWITDYLPALARLDDAIMPAITDYAGWLGDVQITPMPVPHDCHDGFLHAWWRRPRAYLDPRIRSGSSSFWELEGLEDGLARLAEDLDSGTWTARYGHLMALDAYDAGYRLILAAGKG